MLGYVQGRRPRDGMLQLHPHGHTWREWRGLVADGVSFVSGDRRQRLRGATRSDDHGRLYTRLGDVKPQPAHAASAGGKSQKKRVKTKRQGKPSKDGRRDTAPPPSAGPAAGATRAASVHAVHVDLVPARASLAGDGGRWVHVPN